MMYRQLWLIITCTASRVTSAALLSIHTASRVYSIGLTYFVGVYSLFEGHCDGQPHCRPISECG